MITDFTSDQILETYVKLNEVFKVTIKGKKTYDPKQLKALKNSIYNPKKNNEAASN